MSKRILIIDSGASGRNFFGLILKRWADTDSQVCLWSASEQLSVLAKEKKWQFINFPKINSLAVNWSQRLKFLIFKIKLLKTNWPKSYDTVVMMNWPEKIFLSKLVRRLNIRLIWIEDGTVDYGLLSSRCLVKLNIQSIDTKILAINQTVISSLTESGYDKDSLRLIPDCTRPGLIQADLFQNLARHFKLRKDYFTVGAKVDWQSGNLAEVLIKALQICLDVSPHFQLVLMGNGPAHDQIKWLIKRWRLDTQVWLVGEQVQSEKWLESFSTLVLATRQPDWDDVTLATTAMAKNITVIGEPQTSLDSLLNQEYGQLVSIEDSQALATAWLGLYQNPPVANNYQTRPFIKQLVSFEALADKLLAII